MSFVQPQRDVRPTVMSFQDGIVTTAAVAIGMLLSRQNMSAVKTATFVSVVAGAFSMAMAEYTAITSKSFFDKDVSAQRASFFAFISFIVGSIFPSLVLFTPASRVWKMYLIALSTVVGMILFGALFASVSEDSYRNSIERFVIAGGIAVSISIGMMFFE